MHDDCRSFLCCMAHHDSAHMHSGLYLHCCLHDATYTSSRPQSYDCEEMLSYQLCCLVKHSSLLNAQALATHCSKVSDHKLLQQSAKAILEVLKACHDAANDLKDTSSSSKLYTAGFRALNSIIAALRSEHGMSTAELVELLRHFFTYGNELVAATTIPFTAATAGGTAVTVTAAPGASQGSGSVRTAAYRPPHARRRSSSSTGIAAMYLCTKHVSVSTRLSLPKVHRCPMCNSKQTHPHYFCHHHHHDQRLTMCDHVVSCQHGFIC